MIVWQDAELAECSADVSLGGAGIAVITLCTTRARLISLDAASDCEMCLPYNWGTRGMPACSGVFRPWQTGWWTGGSGARGLAVVHWSVVAVAVVVQKGERVC
ncbi:hypothetical protein Q7P37_007229 [Cladosporium fusiforme]